MSATSPDHYRNHPAGLECIDIVRYLPCPIANVVKYLWRWEQKGGVEDLEKALVYLGWIDPVTVQLLRSVPDTTPTRYNIRVALRNLERHHAPVPDQRPMTIHVKTGRAGALLDPLYLFLRWVDSEGNDWASGYSVRDQITQKITELQGERA